MTVEPADLEHDVLRLDDAEQAVVLETPARRGKSLVQVILEPRRHARVDRAAASWNSQPPTPCVHLREDRVPPLARTGKGDLMWSERMFDPAVDVGIDEELAR